MGSTTSVEKQPPEEPPPLDVPTEPAHQEVAAAGLARYSFHLRRAVGLTDGQCGLPEDRCDCCIHSASLLCASNAALRRSILTCRQVYARFSLAKRMVRLVCQSH